MGEVRQNGGIFGQTAFQTEAGLQIQAIGRLQKGCNSRGLGSVVRFPRI